MKEIPVIGIGASAGGLEALEQFFRNMPKNCRMAFVVIQHLAPEQESTLPELLQRTTEMKVVRVTDQLYVEENHIYVLPPNKNVSILNDRLHLLEPLGLHGLELPVDYFFRSLADDREEKSIGVILSGMGSDGSLGLKAIKEKNGTVLVQEPSTAKFDGMPQSAINSVIVDILAPANELPKELIAFLKNSSETVQKGKIDDKYNNDLEKIVILLRSQTGHDFSLYKKNTLFRRIERRMNLHQIDDIGIYIRFLQENPQELDILFKELLIGVTNFFRDKPVWEKLKEKILPDLFNDLPDGYVLRVWVIGCSTGEEAYSLAIVLNEVSAKVKSNKNITLQIFATDIDSNAIEIARKGFYNQNIVSDVEPERINQFFKKTETGFQVKSIIREMIVFAPHNVIKDPPFNKIDLLLCRNLLIYMEQELQRKLMNLFHYSLNAYGVMVLGSAESDNSQNNQFSPIDTKLKFYKRSSVSFSPEMMDYPSSFTNISINESNKIEQVKATDNIQTITERLLLQRFAPASVLINKDGDILYITGRTGKYLEPAVGKANMNIYAMARAGLSHELPRAIRQAIQNHKPIRLHNIKIGINGGTQIVDITLQLVEEPEAIKGTIIIVFYDVDNIQREKRSEQKSVNQSSTNREQELENELQQAKEELQSTREEMQASQEELKSSNEEMQSTNEELQSTNEELTTSKEEMQSLNEELQTVNNELQSKVNDLTNINNDMKNLLNSTDIATLFLDNKLHIRRYTDKLTKLFRMRETDIGRPFTDMVNRLQYPEMEDHINEVLQTLVYRETAISTNDNKWFTVRIMPYRTIDDRIDGVVITFIEITKSIELEKELNKANNILRKHNLYKP